MTERWTPLVEKRDPRTGFPGRAVSGERLRYLACDTRFIVVVAGRRSMKTEIARRKLAWRFIHSTPGQNFFFAGPTELQAKNLAWRILKQLIPKELIQEVNESELRITHINGSTLTVVGLDKPQRIEGVPIDGIVIDEFPDIKKGAWEFNVRPALADRGGWAILLGVPDYDKENNIVFKELYERGLTDDPEWTSFHWWSEEVLPDSEIAAMERDMTPEAYLQEARASFISAPGRAYPHFDKGSHVWPVEFNPERPILVSLDFNYGHHIWNIYQHSPKELFAIKDHKLQDHVYTGIDEIYLKDARVEDMIVALHDRLKPMLEKMKDKVVMFYGDYSGEQKKAEATTSAWRQVRTFFDKDKPEFKDFNFNYRPQPAISTRLEAANKQILNASKEVGVLVNPRCKMLINDFSEVGRVQLFNQNKTGHTTHASDNFGYCVLQHRF